MTIIGDNIKKQRKKCDLTLAEVADKIGISRQTLSRYETGIIGNIPSDKIEALARILNTSPACLMGWEDGPKKTRPSEDERVNDILAKNETLRDFYNILITLPDDKQTELLETAIFLAEKKSQQQQK